jgi:hypothetical protein
MAATHKPAYALALQGNRQKEKSAVPRSFLFDA